MNARVTLYQALITGPFLAAILVAFILTRKRVLAYVRSSRWSGVIGWWLLGALPWVVVMQVRTFLIFGTNWFSRTVVTAFDVVLPLTMFTLPFFAFGATGVWIHSRVRKVRDTNVTPRERSK
jgi:hypothetical protein